MPIWTSQADLGGSSLGTAARLAEQTSIFEDTMQELSKNIELEAEASPMFPYLYEQSWEHNFSFGA